jgi:subtilisin family serine protease
MALFKVGDKNLDLKAVGVGARPSPAGAGEVFGEDPAVPVEIELTERERRDFNAFRSAGYDFLSIRDVRAKSAERLNEGTPGLVGLLARHPAGSLVFLEPSLFVKLAPGVSIEDRRERYAKVQKLDFGENLYEVHVRLEGRRLQDALLAELRQLQAEIGSGQVVFAEPSILYHLDRQLSFTLPPAAEEAGTEEYQWHWKKIGLEDAWGAGKRSDGGGTRVAVIDFGFDSNDQLRKVAWCAEVYADGSRKFRDAADLPKDDHGIACAALIGAPRDSSGVYGAAPGCELILVVLNTGRIAGAKALAAAISLCALGDEKSGALGAHVISCSLGCIDYGMEGAALRTAIDGARGGRNKLGTPVVWATYNDVREIDPNELEAYDSLICVSASDSADTLYQSAYGKGMDLIAPGENLRVLNWHESGWKVAVSGGASLAAPCVAGVAALVLATNDSLTAQQVAEIIQDKCNRSDGVNEWRERRGWGRLNALEAVTAADALNPKKESDLAA